MLDRLTSSPPLPLPLHEVKERLRVEHGDDDSYISSLIAQAVEIAEMATNRAIARQDFQLITEHPCRRFIEIPRPPLVEVSKVEYLNTSGTFTAWTDYRAAKAGQSPAKIILKSTPGDIDATAPDAWRITFTAGDFLPHSLRAALLMIAAHLYDCPDSEQPVLSDGITRILNLYRVAHIG